MGLPYLTHAVTSFKKGANMDTGVQISKCLIFRPATKEGHNLFRDIRRDIGGGRKIASAVNLEHLILMLKKGAIP